MSRGRARRTRTTWRGLAVLVLAAALPGQAQAAEVQVVETDGRAGEVAVERGKTQTFFLRVSATGPISCGTTQDSPATAQIDTSFSVGGDGSIASGTPSSRYRFYSNGLPGCGVDWDVAPDPYLATASVSADLDTPNGIYRARVRADVRNPAFSFLGPLQDAQVTELDIKVIGPLPPPLEGPGEKSHNLYPSTGKTFVKVPGGRFELLTQPVHIPDNSLLDLRNGHGFLDSDVDGPAGKATTRAELWAGYMKLDYTHKLFNGPDTAADKPITEFILTGRTGRRLRCARKRARKGQAQTSRRRRKRRRRAWLRGRGRYRTRGRYGAGAIRGTTLYTEDRCDGTLIRVLEGRRGVTVRDFYLKLDFRVGPGEAYFAARAGRARARN